MGEALRDHRGARLEHFRALAADKGGNGPVKAK